MSALSKSANLRFFLDGVEVDAPIEWLDIAVLATFDNSADPKADVRTESVQANITTDEFAFTNEEKVAIQKWITGGLSGGVGIFEGMPFKIESFNQDQTINSFEGFLDLTQDFKDDFENVRVSAKLKKDNGLNTLDERLSAITYGFLDANGDITNSDYIETNYIVQPKITALEILFALFMLFLLIKELLESIRGTLKAIFDAIGHVTGGISGTIAGAVFAIAVAIIQIAYTFLIVVAIINLGRQLINLLLPPTRKNKVINWRTALSKVATHLGYVFVSPLVELDHVAYQPSNLNLDDVDSKTGFIKKLKGTPKGIPNSTDFGYLASEMFELAKLAFNAKFAIIGNELHLRTDLDPFWVQQSTYHFPSITVPVKSYNTDDFRGDRIIKFQTDLHDEYTIDRFKGTNFEVQTDAINVKRERAKFLKRIEQVNLNVALASRKNKLSALENIILQVASFIDGVIQAFGGHSNLAGSVKKKIGSMIVSANDWSLPKLVYLNGNKIPSNHRSVWSAKVLWDKYHVSKSFVDQNFVGQKEIFRDVRVGFGLEDFVSLINNSYFTTFDGEIAKVIKISWTIGQDFAILDYWIRKPYTKNLIETKIEPQ